MSANDYTVELNGHLLEYDDDFHAYFVDGLIVPSVTQIMQERFGSKYEAVNERVLESAALKGTAVHDAIEMYCKTGIEDTEIVEVHNFKFLQKQYKFNVLNNEMPLIIFKDNQPLCAGRCDLVLSKDNKIGLGDIKRTSALDKDYLSYQLNLYRIGYMQCYHTDIDFLYGVWLRNDTRKLINISINEALAWNYLERN